MVSSAAQTVEQYLAEIAPDRRAILTALRDTVREHIQPGFIEEMAFGMPCFAVPLSTSGPTYNGKPLLYIAMASQKQSVSLYLMPVYMQPDLLERFSSAWLAASGRLDMGKSCVRIRNLGEVPLELVAWIAGLLSPEEFVARSGAARDR